MMCLKTINRQVEPMSKKNCVYGIDSDKPFTARDVRDAIVRCFAEAHRAYFDRGLPEVPREDRLLRAEAFLRATFDDINGDFDNPTKESLMAVINELAQLSLMFRSQKLIKKYFKEIKQLIERL